MTAVVSVVECPLCEVPSLEGVVEWEAAVETQAHRYPEQAKQLSFLTLISPSVLTVARLSLGEADFKRLEAETSLAKITDALAALFVPVQADVCLAMLKRFRWDQPDVGITTSMIQYCDHYERTARRLVPPLCSEVIWRDLSDRCMELWERLLSRRNRPLAVRCCERCKCMPSRSFERKRRCCHATPKCSR